MMRMPRYRQNDREIDYSKGGDGGLDVRSQAALDAQKAAEEAIIAEQNREEDEEFNKDAPEH